MLPDWIVVRPKALGEFCVDDHHLLAVTGVTFREEPPLHQWNVHGAEVAGARRADVCLEFLPGKGLITFHINAAPPYASSQRQHGNQTGGLHAREVADAIPDLLMESGKPLPKNRYVLAGLRTVDSHLHRKNMVG